MESFDRPLLGARKAFTSEDVLNQRGIWFYAGSLYRGFVILGFLYRGIVTDAGYLYRGDLLHTSCTSAGLFLIYVVVITRGSLNLKPFYLGVIRKTVEVFFYLVTQHQNTVHALDRFGVFFQVAGMYQDPSIGEIKVYYVVTKIIVLNSTAEQVRIDNCINVLTSLD